MPRDVVNPLAHALLRRFVEIGTAPDGQTVYAELVAVSDGSITTSRRAVMVQSLSGATSPGAGAAADVSGCLSFAMQVVHTGLPTTITVELEGTINGTHWVTLATWTNLAPGDIVFVVDKPVAQVRANLTALLGGTSPTVSAWIIAV